MRWHPDLQAQFDNPTRWQRRLGLAWVMTGTVLVMMRPTLHSMRSTLPTNLGDTSLNTWSLAWQSHALTTHPSQWFGGNVFFPYGNSLGYSELMMPLLAVFGPIFLATGNPILAYNVTQMALLILCLWATFRLARYLGCSPVAAYFAALAFSFSAYTFAHSVHLQLLTLGFFPLGFLCMFRMFDRRRKRDGLALGIVTAALVTACLYYGVIWLLTIAVLVAIDVRKSLRKNRSVSSIRPHLIAAGVAGALLAPVGLLYVHFQASSGFHRPLLPGEGLRPSDFLSPATGSRVYGAAGQAAGATFAGTGHMFFMGASVLVLAAVGLATIRIGSRNATDDAAPDAAPVSKGWLALLIAALIAFGLAVGPQLGALPGPFRFFYNYVPGFDSIRAVARLAVPGLLVVALLAAAGLDWVRAHLRFQPMVVGVVACLLVALELSVSVPRVDATRSAAANAMYVALKGKSAGPVIELPIAGSRDGLFALMVEERRMMHSIGDWRHRVNGVSGGNPLEYNAKADGFASFPDARSVEQLRTWGVKFVVLHTSNDGETLTYTVAQAREIVAALPAGAIVEWLPDGVIITFA